MYKKRTLFHIFFAFLLLFLAVFVIASSHLENLEEAYFNPGEDGITDENLEKINQDPKEFVNHLQDKLKLQGLSDLDVSKFDSDGNMVLKNGQKISLQKIYDYNSIVNDQGIEPSSYDFKGNSYSSEFPPIKKVSTDADGNVLYEFENSGSLTLDSDSSYDFETRTITSGDQEIVVKSLKGGLSVKDGKVEMSVSLDNSLEYQDLKDFPILEVDGSFVSPQQKISPDTAIPEDIDVSKIPSGKFKTFTQDGKQYSVSSDGIVRVIGDDGAPSASVSQGESGQLHASNVYLSNEDYGEVFLGDNMDVYLGTVPPEGLSTNHVYIGKAVDGKRDLTIISNDGSTFYQLSGDIGTLALKGNVFVKNGDGVFVSDADGNIKTKLLVYGGTFEHTIDKLYHIDKPNRVYEGKVEAGAEVTSISGEIEIDLSGITRGSAGNINTNTVKGSPSFQQLVAEAGLDGANTDSVALAITRNFKELGIEPTETNIKLFTEQILGARETFGDRVLIGSEVDNFIWVAHGESKGRRFNRQEIKDWIAQTGQQNFQDMGTNGGGALEALSQSKGSTTFFFNGHGNVDGFSTGRNWVSSRAMAQALYQRHLNGEDISDVNIISHACYQYDFAQNLRNQLQFYKNKDPTVNFPVIITEANRGRPSHTYFGSFGYSQGIEWFNYVNRQSGGSFTGNQYFPSEKVGRSFTRDDPALFVPVNINGETRLMEIS